MSLSDPSSRVRRARLPGVVLVAAFVLAGCNLAIGVDVVVHADGSGVLELAFRLDEELAGSLEADGFDPTFGLDQLEETGTDWNVDVDRGGGMTVRVSAPFADQASLDARVAELNEGIDVAEDGSLLDALEVTVLPDDRVRVTGTATLMIPASTGATGDGVVFDGDDLRTMLESEGADVLLAEVRFRMPGPVEDTNADEVDGNLATWTLALDETRELSAEARPSEDRTVLLVAAVAAVGLAAGIVLSRMRRR